MCLKNETTNLRDSFKQSQGKFAIFVKYLIDRNENPCLHQVGAGPGGLTTCISWRENYEKLLAESLTAAYASCKHRSLYRRQRKRNRLLV
jgi:hypothetical protein